MEIIYCLVPKHYWEKWAENEYYLPRDYEQEGFIHATKGDDLLTKVAGRVYGDTNDELYVLVIDEQKVTAPIKYEKAKDGLLYPHIYGKLNTDAIAEIRQMVKIDGQWAIGDRVDSHT